MDICMFTRDFFYIQVQMPEILIPVFFSVQKISIPSIEMVCRGAVLAVWEDDEGEA